MKCHCGFEYIKLKKLSRRLKFTQLLFMKIKSFKIGPKKLIRYAGKIAISVLNYSVTIGRGEKHIFKLMSFEKINKAYIGQNFHKYWYSKPGDTSLYILTSSPAVIILMTVANPGSESHTQPYQNARVGPVPMPKGQLILFHPFIIINYKMQSLPLVVISQPSSGYNFYFYRSVQLKPSNLRQNLLVFKAPRGNDCPLSYLLFSPCSSGGL